MTKNEKTTTQIAPQVDPEEFFSKIQNSYQREQIETAVLSEFSPGKEGENVVIVNGIAITEETRNRIDKLKTQINPYDDLTIIKYGEEAQSNVGNFANEIIKSSLTQDLGDAGDILSDAVAEIKGYSKDCEDKGPIMSIVYKLKKQTLSMKDRYKTVLDNMDSLALKLSENDKNVEEISESLERMFCQLSDSYKSLGCYIIAGQEIAQKEKARLTEVFKKAQDSGDAFEVQKVKSDIDKIARFEKRIHDLAIARSLCIEQGCQAKIIQKGANDISDAIKSTISLSLEIWRTQMAIALAIVNVKGGLNAVNAAHDCTNEMLLKVSGLTKTTAIETAKASERAIVDMTTIQEVNSNLLEALVGMQEVARIAREQRKQDIIKIADYEEEFRKNLRDSGSKLLTA